ncbi:hypothetical protein ACIQXA_11080 [Streptomyces massasporeus]|uniref:hypothetical protein n=1 Tax=Streptomyces massasporeus TaxID=67324 RepID=UPI0038212DB4
MGGEEPEHLLIRARGDTSPLYTTDAGALGGVEEFTRAVPVDDDALALPGEVARKLTEWNANRPAGGFEIRPALRKHVRQGWAIARLMAQHLGPGRAVRFWDERHRGAKLACRGRDGSTGPSVRRARLPFRTRSRSPSKASTGCIRCAPTASPASLRTTPPPAFASPTTSWPRSAPSAPQTFAR